MESSDTIVTEPLRLVETLMTYLLTSLVTCTLLGWVGQTSREVVCGGGGVTQAPSSSRAGAAKKKSFAERVSLFDV